MASAVAVSSVGTTLDGAWQVIQFKVTGGPATIPLISLNGATGEVSSSYFDTDQLLNLSNGAKALLANIDPGDIGSAVAPILSRLIGAASLDATALSQTTSTVGTTATISVTVATDQYFAAYVPSDAAQGFIFGGAGAGGGGSPSGPAGGVLGYPGSTYPNPTGFAGVQTVPGGILDMPIKHPGNNSPPEVLAFKVIDAGFIDPPADGDFAPTFKFSTADGGRPTNPDYTGAPNGGFLTIELGNGANATEVDGNPPLATSGGPGGAYTLRGGDGGDGSDFPGTPIVSDGIPGGDGGYFDIGTGVGGAAGTEKDAKGGNGGFFTVATGQGASGVNLDPSKAGGGIGGYIGFSAGNAGGAADVNYDDVAVPKLRRNAGGAGYIEFESGNGGEAYDDAPLLGFAPYVPTDVIFPNTGAPSPGGDIAFFGGDGGAGAVNVDGARGADIILEPGDGGPGDPVAPPGVPTSIAGRAGRTIARRVFALGFSGEGTAPVSVANGDLIGPPQDSVQLLDPGQQAAFPVVPAPVTIQLGKAFNAALPALFASSTRAWGINPLAFPQMAAYMTPGDIVIIVNVAYNVLSAPPALGDTLGNYIEMDSDESVRFVGGTVTLKPQDTVTLMYVPQGTSQFIEIARAVTP